HRFLFRSHQFRSATEPVHVCFVSPKCRTCVSNSVGTAGAGGSGLPQLGFPRRRLTGWMNGFTMPQMILRPASAGVSTRQAPAVKVTLGQQTGSTAGLIWEV